MNNNLRTSSQNIGVYNMVRAIIADKLCIDQNQIGMSSGLIDLGADSLDAIELIMEFEKEFGISIPDSAADSMRTVGDICNYLAKHACIAAKGGASYGTRSSSKTIIGSSSTSTKSSSTTGGSSLFKDWLNERRA